jgi:hypothetical protein
VRRIFLTAWTIWLFDFATKQWAISNFDAQPRAVLGDFLSFTLVRHLLFLPLQLSVPSLFTQSELHPQVGK